VPRSIRSTCTLVSVVGLLVALMSAIAGCQSTTQPAQPSPYIRKAPAAAAAGGAGAGGAKSANQAAAPAISNTDPCASRLHDICEPLLLYYLKNHQLPRRLEELRDLPGFEQIELTCPVSNKPYLYNPIGITTAENRTRLICYDPAPSHFGLRWAISIIEPEENGPLVTKVIGLPESHFSFMGGR
jgi:hypothetical protein